MAMYRDFITGWFSRHIQVMVVAIALGQAAIALLMASRVPARRWLGAAGASVFLLAIAPLGVGSGFPFSLTFGAALFVALVPTRAITSTPACPPPASLCRGTRAE